MTVFLCILALLCCSTKVKGSGWALVALYALEVVLVLGLAALAVWCWSQP